jgi:hypothetical protein
MPGYPATAPTFIQMPMNEIAFLTAEVIVNLAHQSTVGFHCQQHRFRFTPRIPII